MRAERVSGVRECAARPHVLCAVPATAGNDTTAGGWPMPQFVLSTEERLILAHLEN